MSFSSKASDANSLPEDDWVYTSHGFDNIQGADLDTGKKSEKPHNISVSDVESHRSREVWSKPTDFLMSCISLSVGLGNVIRFPITVNENGGGAFWVAYLIVLTFIVRPLYYLEMCLGQFSSYSQVRVWSICPLFKGIGWATMQGSICVVFYYCTTMSVTIYYLLISFSKIFPWSICQPLIFNSETCVNFSMDPKVNLNLSQHYYEEIAFKQKESIDDGVGYPGMYLSLCLFLSWALIFLSLFKGVKISGKVAYFTATFPMVVLLILIARSISLDGAFNGLFYFIEPHWEKLLEIKTWSIAVNQCFFSLSAGFGPITTFASHNKFNRNILRDTMIISITDTITSLCACVVFFSFMGNLAVNTGVSINELLKNRHGNVIPFVLMPAAFSYLDSKSVPQIYAVLFFLMMFVLGIGGATSLVGSIIAVILDENPSIKDTGWKITLAICFLGFFVGLVFVTPGGMFLISIVDYYGADYVIYIMALLEVLSISFIYGLERFSKDIEYMLRTRVSLYWKISWRFTTPLGLLGILVYWAVKNKPLTYNESNLPIAAIACGWLLSGIALSMVPIFALRSLFHSKRKLSLKDRFKNILRCKSSWGPREKVLRDKWLALNNSHN